MLSRRMAVGHTPHDRKGRQHDRHGAPQTGPGQEDLLAPGHPEPGEGHDDGQRPGDQQQDRSDDDRRHQFGGQIAGIDEQAEQDEQADLREPAEPFGEGPGRRPCGSPELASTTAAR